MPLPDHLQIGTEDGTQIHLRHPVLQDATLCGLDACDGDPTLGILPPIQTTRPIDCPICLQIIRACRSLALCEFPSQRRNRP